MPRRGMRSGPQGGGLPGYLASTASSASRTRTSPTSASHQSKRRSDASCAELKAPSTPCAADATLLRRKESFLAKSVKGIASTAARQVHSHTSHHASSRATTFGGTPASSGQGAAKNQRKQASAGIRRRFQRGTQNSKKKKNKNSMSQTPPRNSDDAAGEDPRRRSPASPDLTATTADLSMMTAASDLSLAASSPDRPMASSTVSSAAAVSSPPSSSVQSSRRIERAAAALDAAGHRHLEEGRVADALESYRRALKLKRRVLNDTNGGDGGAAHEVLPIAQGEEAMLGTATSIGQSNGEADGAQKNDPHREALLASVATSVNNVCFARQMMGLASPDEALHAYQSSLAIKRQVKAGDIGGTNNTTNEKTKHAKPRSKDDLTDQEQHDLSVAKTLNNIGTVHLSTGAYPSALSSFRESCGLMLSILGPDHIDVSTVYSNAGDALLGMKRYGEAAEEYGRALKIRADRSGLDHRKSQRLLEKIRVAAKAAAVAKQRQEKEEQAAAEEKQRAQEEKSDVPTSPASSKPLVETLQRWFGETDVRDYCLLTDQCESDEEDDPFGDLKSQLENDLDLIANIGHDLEEDIMKEQAAIMEEIRRTDETAGSGEHTVANGDDTEADARATGEAPRRIRSAADANAAVREVRERLAKVRARRQTCDDGLEALRRVPVGSSFGNSTT